MVAVSVSLPCFGKGWRWRRRWWKMGEFPCHGWWWWWFEQIFAASVETLGRGCLICPGEQAQKEGGNEGLSEYGHDAIP